MARAFLGWPHPLLRRPVAPVDAVTDAHRALWDEMIAAMEAMPGLGLAAPQIGEGVALAVVDASEARGQAIRLANPRVLWASEETSAHREASPNLTGVSAEIVRPASVEVAYLDEGGAERARRFDGLWATSVQHQIDHLAGRMFFDRLSRTKRAMLLKKAGRRT